MICDCLPIVGVLLFRDFWSLVQISNSFLIDQNLSADRPFNHRARRAGTGKKSVSGINIFSGGQCGRLDLGRCLRLLNPEP
jgi:hypothetical protein